MTLEEKFEKYREGVIGKEQEFVSPFGKQKIVYADWTASGRMYAPIEERMQKEIFPFVGNTHTETSVTGASMTKAYHEALHILKLGVNAGKNDVIISSGPGMTDVVNKFQRILGLKIHEKVMKKIALSTEDKPVVFITHMEHHSNQTSWLETVADVVVVPPSSDGLVSVDSFRKVMEQYADRGLKIASVTACSNVTGIETPYHEIAEVVHELNGLCFVDFACSAPYVAIDMHPENEMQKLDAVFFSPHKFLGGPGSTGVLVFDATLYSNTVPDNPGGGTVSWTNPWGSHAYVSDIESREDGGTPAFLQTIKAAFSMQLKNEMGIDNIADREEEIVSFLWGKLTAISNLHLLAENVPKRLGILSFYIDDLHYNLGVQLLNDRFGIQVRGGCSCAGTYGHYLLEVSEEQSDEITEAINFGDASAKPGWIRMSIHPVMADKEVKFLADCIQELAENHREWAADYEYSNKTNEFSYIGKSEYKAEDVSKNWFRKL